MSERSMSEGEACPLCMGNIPARAVICRGCGAELHQGAPHSTVKLFCVIAFLAGAVIILKLFGTFQGCLEGGAAGAAICYFVLQRVFIDRRVWVRVQQTR